LRTSQKIKGLLLECRRKGKRPSLFSEGGKGDGRDIDADRLRGGKNSAKVIVYDIYGGEVRVGGDNGVEEGIDGGKGSGVGAYIVLYIYLVAAYRPSDSPLLQSVHFIPLLLHYSLKIGGGLGGADDREEALEGDQELDELLFIHKRPLLAMRPAGSGGEGQGLAGPVEVKV
jgi:hypothetical protein